MLAVTGGKGGTGKTTTTLGLARALAAVGADVRCVDADVDLPDLGALAGGPRRVGGTEPAEPETEAAAETETATDRESATDRETAAGDPADVTTTGTFADSVEPSVRVRPAPADPASADAEEIIGRLGSEERSGTTVLVDCPAGAGPDAAAPLRVADAALLVSEPCAPSLRDAAKSAAMARALGATVVGAVLTRARFAPEAVSSLLGCPVVACVPRARGPPLDDPRVRAAHREAAATLAAEPGFSRVVTP